MVTTEEKLNQTEANILQLLADGKRPKQVAVALHLTVHTVNQYMVTIRAKVRAETTSNAIATALRQGIID